MEKEESTLRSRGQIVVPARLRKRYGLRSGTKVYFIERNGEIILQPVTKEYIRSLCGMLISKTSITKELLKERKKDRQHEEGSRLDLRRHSHSHWSEQ